MFKLIKNEFKKFSNSYINTVAFVAMLFPVVFTSLIYYFGNSFAFEWYAYINSLHLFYGIFLGSLIPSFIAIFAVYVEFKEGTIKNLTISPHSRAQIIIAKTLYVLIFIVCLYIAVGILVLLSGLLIGLNTSFADAVNVFKLVTVTGMTTVILAPMMIFFTLVFRSFIVPVIITFLGTVVGIPLINVGMSYFYPWMIPSNFFFRLGSSEAVSYSLPLIVLVSLTALFFILSVVKFRRMDFDN